MPYLIPIPRIWDMGVCRPGLEDRGVECSDMGMFIGVPAYMSQLKSMYDLGIDEPGVALWSGLNIMASGREEE